MAHLFSPWHLAVAVAVAVICAGIVLARRRRGTVAAPEAIPPPPLAGIKDSAASPDAAITGASLDLPVDKRDLAASLPHRVAAIHAMFALEGEEVSPESVAIIAARVMEAHTRQDLLKAWKSYSRREELGLVRQEWLNTLFDTSWLLVHALRRRREMREVSRGGAPMFYFRLQFSRVAACLHKGHAGIDGITARGNDPFWDEVPLIFDWNCECTVLPVPTLDMSPAEVTGAQRPLASRFPEHALELGRSWMQTAPRELQDSPRQSDRGDRGA